MWWKIINVVGIPIAIGVAIFIGGLYLIDYGKKQAEQEVLIEQQEEYIDTTRRIQNAVKSNRHHSVDAAREWLRQRQSD
jgi:hypothetical protein